VPIAITGTVEDAGVSRGKTLAAWNGIPSGEPWLRVRPDPGQDLLAAAPEVILVSVPRALMPEEPVGQALQLVGRWRLPAPVEPPDDDIPRQMPIELKQMPIELKLLPPDLSSLDLSSADLSEMSATLGEIEGAAPSSEVVEAWVPVAREPVFEATGLATTTNE
jgi:hypothetical protein